MSPRPANPPTTIIPASVGSTMGCWSGVLGWRPGPTLDDRRSFDLDPEACGAHAGPVDDDVGTECPLGCLHSPDRVGFEVESEHLDAALDRGARGFGCPREPLDCPMLVQVAVGCAVAAAR